MDKTCSICGLEKPTTDFYKKLRTADGLDSRCKACISVYNKTRWKEDDDYREKRGEQIKDYQKSEQGKEKLRQAMKEWRKNNPEKARERADRHRIYQLEIRRFIVGHYSGGRNCCDCCGEPRFEFLAIDHVNGGGGKHRKEHKLTGGNRLAYWLLNNGLPEGFRILCHNCNMVRGCYGYCPHESPDLSPETVNPRRKTL